MSAVPYTSKPVHTPQDAIASHVRWKIALLLASQMHEALSERALEAIRFPGKCLVGIWLASEHTVRLRGTPEYRAVISLHAAYHGEMQCIANLLQAADYVQAERILNDPGPYQSISNSLGNAIMSLDRLIAPHLSPKKTIPAK